MKVQEKFLSDVKEKFGSVSEGAKTKLDILLMKIEVFST